jgi:6-pyruvoyltetrahydropterin/6-carboxytetrahydropterin synthase
LARYTTIELFKEAMKFSAGHFTIFSAERRENLHGHNFNVYASLRAPVGEDGMTVDYTVLRKEMLELCSRWNEVFLLPAHSPFLRLEETATHWLAHFGPETLSFLKRDVLVLPVRNVTLEELSGLMLDQLLRDRERLAQWGIIEIVVRVFSGPGQSASSEWSRDTETRAR